MKITNIYKTTAALIFLMVAALWPAAEAWGQVTGDLYAEFESVSRNGLSEVRADVSPNGESNIFDGDDNSYWIARDHTSVTFTFRFWQNRRKTFDAIRIFGGGDVSERPVSITFESGDFTQTFDDLDTSDRNLTLYLSRTVRNTDEFSLTFVPQDQSDAKIALNEIYLLKRGELMVRNVTIRHKPAKWHDLRENLSQAAKDMDTFDDGILEDTIQFPGIDEYTVQAAHTLIDTIYVHKGSSVRLTLPDRLNESTNMNSYQRWYSFRTDQTFEVNNPDYDGGIKDLLTPAIAGSYYRFNNGYVTYSNQGNSDKPYSMDFYFPTDEEFEQMFTGFNTSRDNNWYLVACDVSGYDDFTENFGVNQSKNSTFLPNGWEPTLTHRLIYYICAVENESNWYVQALKEQGADEYLEDYVIHMPATRLPNKTNEMVALSKDARAYALPGSDTDEGLTVTIDANNNTAGITLAAGNDSHTTSSESDGELTLIGETRKIHFLYPESNGDNTRSVKADNTEASILVKKGGKNIARFRLIFSEESRLLTQSQVSELDDLTQSGTGWRSLTYRTPDALNDNPNYELLTELNFDYDNNVAPSYGLSQYYPFPMGWKNSSYGFYDGGNEDYISSRQNDYTEWGHYSILNDYLECGTWAWNQSKPKPDDLENSKGVASTFHLFVDASDRPGVIARLPFPEDLCSGTELFVSAWVKSARYDTNADNAGMLFTIMGAETDENGQEKLTPIYRYQTGQIPATYQNDQSINLPGFVTGKNEWFQVYFSFVNSGNLSFDRYILQIDNNSASTSGGDMYLDDVRVYISKPTPHVSQKEFSCINERTKMNFYLNWRQLCERLGMDENSTVQGTRAIDFCFVDTVKYTNAIKEGKEPETALNLAIEHIGDGNDDPNGEGYDETIATIHFYENFNSHNVYNTQGDNLAKDNKIGDNYFFYRAGSGEDRKLSVDFYATLSPYRPYWMLIRDNNTGSVSTFSDFAASINDPCGIKSDFYVEPTALIKVNGEIVKPETDFCIGQIFNFTAQVRVPTGSDDEGNETYMLLDDVNFDWFFGTEDEFIAENPDFEDVSLNEALTQFRDIEAYRDYESMEGVSAQGAFTKEHINIINYYLNEAGTAGGRHKRLVLCKPNLDISMLEGGLQVVMRPIKTTRPSGITEDQWANICWEYIPLALTTNQDAPVLHAGFNSVKYPTDDFNPSLRIGLGQIRQASDEANTLIIDLRGAQLVSSGATSLGLIESRTEEENNVYQQIYLTGSTDPECIDWLNKYPGAFSLPIGRITELFAEKYESGSDFNDHAKVYFYLTEQTLDDGAKFTFKPREGYEYTFSLHFEEHGKVVYNTCEGTFPLTMKVVPEYLVWNDTQKSDDGTIGNWNNDDNWQRVASGRIQAAEDNTSDYFTNGTNANASAFVPMLFSKVIMPRDSKVELYAAGYGENGKWNNSARPDNIAEPTPNIQYDLMAFEHGGAGVQEGDLKTERYRVSLLNQIHFEPGAEMLHAEYLLYNKAWVDYQLGKGRWYTLASPLKAVYAGDFYTDKSGTEGSEYFKDITFNTTDNKRFNPSVYQRAWKGNATLQTLNSGTKNVAISGNWSALYNDVAEAYTPGTGFSLKVQDIGDNNSATFRLPKADGSYKYYSYDGKTSGNPTNISRDVDASGRLKSDELLDRRTDNASLSTSFTIELADAHGGYYLVGNPFMAHLDMTKFFNENTSFAEMYWLVTEKGQEVAVGGSGDGLISTGTGKIAPLQSFFVKLKTDEAGNLVEAPENITFTQDMQALGGTNDGLRSANALTITATTTDGRISRAAVAYDMAASADYEASEDAELFLDSNLGDVPMVYTVAGTMATSINRTSELYNIPLGVYGNKQEMVTLSFGGLNQFSSATLYDAQEQTETPLHEGKTVSVPAGTSGRYFLRAGTPTGNEVIARNAFLVYSVGGGKVMVTSSNTPLKDIRVYTMGGAQVRSIQASGMQQEIYLNRGIYLITVSDQDGLQETRKVLVR